MMTTAKKGDLTSRVLMIRPAKFALNEETAADNHYQNTSHGLGLDAAEIEAAAQREFDEMAEALRVEHGVDVTVVQDTPVPHTPDSVYPNNWVSFHADGRVVIFPMAARNRRPERRPEVLHALIQKNFMVDSIIDLSGLEGESPRQENDSTRVKSGKDPAFSSDGHAVSQFACLEVPIKDATGTGHDGDKLPRDSASRTPLFLEGTGSMVLDRQEKVAYAALSQRTHKEALDLFCKNLGYKPVTFHAYQWVHAGDCTCHKQKGTDGTDHSSEMAAVVPHHHHQQQEQQRKEEEEKGLLTRDDSAAVTGFVPHPCRKLIYHTNVMMCIGCSFVVLCEDAIDDPKERAHVRATLEKSSREVINITEDQVASFAGNLLLLRAPTSNKNQKTTLCDRCCVPRSEHLLVMSDSAFASLTHAQRERLGRHTALAHFDLKVIETLGGGSARCMLAEVFLPRASHDAAPIS